MKAEIHSLHEKSEVVEYHDIITDSAIAYLIQSGKNSRPSLSEASFEAGLEGKDVADTDSRLSTTSWLALNHSNETMRIAKLVNRVTGLEVEGNFQSGIQLEVYGPGGHEDVHTDSVREIPLRCSK